jgi:hypothetical protein
MASRARKTSPSRTRPTTSDDLTPLQGPGVTPLHRQPRAVRQLALYPQAHLLRSNVRHGSWLFSNSGRGVKLSVNILAGCRVLSAVGVYPPHDGVR